jgi:hypothetical protein
MDEPIMRHLTDEELVAQLDRECPAGAPQTAHLEGCWSCRTRLDDLESAMHGFIRLRDDVLLAAPEPPPMWPGLEAGMDRVDTEGSGLSLWTRMRRKATATWSARVAVAASVMLVLTLAGATPAAAARLMRDAIRFVSAVFVDVTSARPMAGPAVRVTKAVDVVLPAPPEVRPATRRASRPARPTAPVNLVDLELEALWRLHQVGAFVGEDVSLERSARQLSVQVRVEDAVRKAKVREALAPVIAGGARVSVQTFAETAAVRTSKDALGRVAYQEVGVVTDRSAASSLLMKHFATQFGSEGAHRTAPAARDFSSRVLTAAREITLHAFALRRISERPGSAIEQASAPAQVTYRVLVREYASAVESRAASLTRDLQSIFGASSAPQIEPLAPGIHAIASAALQLEDEVRAAFAVQTGADEPRGIDGGRLVSLALVVERLAAEIRRSNSH